MHVIWKRMVHAFFVIKNPKNPTSGFPGFWRGTRDLSNAAHLPFIACIFIAARTLRYINIRDVYMTLRPFQVRVLCIIKNSKNPTSGFLGFWRGTRDSNPQPTDSKSATLSIELVPQKYIIDYMIIPDVYTCIKGFIDIYLKMAHNKERLSFFWQGM